MRFVAVIAVLALLLAAIPAVADDVDDVKKATLEHFGSLNARDAHTHTRHHVAGKTTFGSEGGLLTEQGSLEEQEEELQALFDAGFRPDYAVRHLDVEVFGKAAVVTCYLVGTTVLPGGKVERVNERRTAVLIKQQDGAWREVHLDASPLTVGMPAARE